VFHWAGSGGETFHWTHEMLAVETSMRGMRELGEHDYARRAVDGLVEDAELLPMVTMLTTLVRPGPLPGL